MFNPILQPNNNRSLQGLYQQITEQKQLLQTLRRALPPQLAQHAQHALWRNDKVIIYTDAAVWASQLRFYQTVLAASVTTAQGKPPAVQIKLLVQRVGVAIITTSPPALLPTARTIGYLQQDSAGINHAPLQQALLKLANTLQRCSGKS